MSDSPDSPQHRSSAGIVSRSHLGVEPFGVHRVSSLAEAASLVAAGAWAHAGGIDVVARLRRGEIAEALVPLGAGARLADGLAILGEIALRNGVLFIGAAVTHDRIATDPLVQAHRPDLAVAWQSVGNARVRACGTVGGNLMAFDTTYDVAPILAAARASLVFCEPDGSLRRCTVSDAPSDRLLVGCEVPLEGRVIYDRSHKPVASVAVGESCVVVGCAHPVVQVIELGAGESVDVTAALEALSESADDAFASAAYRRRVIATLVERGMAEHRLLTDSPDGQSAEATAAGVRSADGSAPSTDGPNARSIGATSDDDAARRDDFAEPARGLNTVDVRLRVNGTDVAAHVPASEMLVDTIALRVGLTGTRIGCDQAVCGACTVLVDNQPTASCSIFSWQADGRQVLTIEAGTGESGAGEAGSIDGHRDPRHLLATVQRAFAEASAFQCGYCTPGLILTTTALLAHHRDPDRRTICDWLDSNICRCTGYLMVIEAVEAAAAALNGDSHSPSVTPL